MHTVRDAYPIRSGLRTLQLQLNNLINLQAEFYVLFKACVNHSGNHDVIQIRKADSRVHLWVGELGALGNLESLKLTFPELSEPWNRATGPSVCAIL